MIETFEFPIEAKSIKISTSQYVKDNIVYNGNDNKYPMNMEYLIDKSETATLCVGTESKFLSTPFVNKEIGKMQYGLNWVNRPYTLDIIKYDIAYSLAKFNGAYIMVTRNLEGKVVSLNVIDFNKVRFTEFDNTMRATGALVGDFGKEIKGGKFNRKNFNKFPLWNGNYDYFKLLSETFGTTSSIYPLFCNTQYYYPSNPYESVIYDLATENEIQLNRYEEITQGTPSKLVIRTDISKDDYVREKELERIANFAGSKGDRVLVISTSFDENGQPINNGYQLDTIQDTRDLSKFSEAEDRTEKNIRKAVQIPSILISPNDGATVDGSAAQLEAAINYYEDIIKGKRKMISDALTEILGFDCSMEEFSEEV